MVNSETMRVENAWKTSSVAREELKIACGW